jgi:1-acyl-sn-glycerol-3-phosphate acyltransferase
MLRAFSIAYWAFVVLTMPVLFSGALLVFLATVAFDPRRIALHLYSCVWGSFYVWMNPLWRVRVTGRERLPWKGPAVIVSNHLSILDILVVYLLFRPFKWVAKAELFKLPFVGWNMRLNDYVAIWRGDRESVKRMMAKCREHLGRGAPILIFPEGTRSRDGALLPFKDGAFRLAWESGAPIVPMVISGTGDALPKHGLVLRQGMRARVEVLEPVSPAAYPSAEALRDAVRAIYVGRASAA